MVPDIYTIGYEGVPLEAFIGTLKAARIEVLLDIRAVPLSRKPGFSKNKLAAKLAENNIRYVGLKGLGTPAEGRHAARQGRIGAMREIFTKHLTTPPARQDMEAARKIAGAARACLLCFEHNPEDCHRLLVAEKLADLNDQAITHLNPAPQLL